MKYIEKREEPSAFIEWKIQERHRLEKWYADQTKASKIWEHLPSKKKSTATTEEGVKYYSKEELRKELLVEQGYICCYCGGRIADSNKTILEHLHPKESNKHRTFDYDNLYASCSGGNPPYYTVKENNERISDICHRLGIQVSTIQQQNRHLNLERLRKGDKVDYQRKQKHCDAKKNLFKIAVSPEQTDCEAKFAYDITGKIQAVNGDKDTVETIKILGLNDNDILKRKRRDAHTGIKDYIFELMGLFQEDFSAVRKVLGQLYDSLNQPQNDKLEEFCFVQRYFIQKYMN